MKKSLFIISAAAVLLTGCAKEQLVEQEAQNGPVNVVSATFEDLVGDDATKAAVADAGTFTWQNGDKAAFAGESAYLEAQNSSATATASFFYSGTLAPSTYGIFPFDLSKGQSVNDGKVKVPTSRAWAEKQTNVAMYATYASNNFNFEHLGGLVKVTINNVPTTATKFVFKTEGWKINGVFDISTDTDSKKKISTSSTTTESEMEYTLTFTAPSSEGTSKDFYVPLPTGTYNKGFAVYLKDNTDNIISQFKGSTSQTVNRKSFLRMPAITLASASIEDVYKDALVETIPAGYSGDYLLPKTDKLVLKIKASSENHDITLKYNGENKPANLEIKVVNGDSEDAGDFNAKLLGNLPYTHVDFRLGHIDHTLLTTSASTFAVIHPATVGTLTVNGGNVKVEGASVTSIVVAANAVASEETKAPVQIVVEKSSSEETFTAPAVTANANVIVAPASGVSVNVTASGGAKVANAGEGSVTGVTTTDAKAKIGENNYFTLADAVKAAPKNATEATTIILLDNVTDGAGIFLADTDKKDIIIDMDGHSYTGVGPAVGSNGTENQLFHIEKGNTFALKNSVPGTGGVVSIDQNKAADFRFIIQNYANLTLDDVTIDGTGLSYDTDGKGYTYALSNNCGTVNLNGTTSIKASTTSGMNNYAFDVCKYSSYDAPTVTWNSTGSVDGIIELSGGEFVVAKNLALTRPIRTNSNPAILTINQDATISQSGAFPTVHTKFTGDSEPLNENNSGLVIVNYGGDLTIKGAGTIEATQGCTAAVCMTEKKEVYSNADAKLKVENVTLKGKGIGITGNGGRHNTVIVINNAKIYGTSTDETDEAVGLYHPQEGTLTINGSNTIIQGLASGVEMRAGTLTVNDGTIEGTATTYSVKSNGNGSTTVGAGLSVAPHTTGKNINVTINGGTFKGAKAFSNTNPEEQPSYVNITINGGTFSDEEVIKYAAANANIAVKLEADRTEGTGVFVKADQHQTITFDLNGHNFVGVAPAVGSQGTENQLFHIERNNNFTLTNSVPSAGGRVSIDENNASAFRFIIMDYAALTLDNVTLDGTNLGHSHTPCYTLSTNYQDVTLQGKTSIIAKGENVAFDAYAYLTSTYPTAPTVTWNSTGSVTGNIELAGGNLVIASDLGYANTIMATEGTSNLEVNATLSATDASDWYLVKAGSNGKSGVVLNISGTGTLSSGTSEHCIPVTSDYGAQVNISGGNYKCYGVNTNTPDGGECVYANRDGKVSISEGTFGVREGDTVKDLLNVQNDQDVTDIQCTGGTFHGKNPADGDDAIGGSFVASGYVSTETTEGSKVWTVSAEQN